MTSKKISFLPLMMAALLLIANRGIISGMLVPVAGDIKYLWYSIIKGFVILGYNLIPLYFGFHSEYFKRHNSLSKLSRFSIIYLFASSLPVIVLCALLDSVRLKDIWSIFFPISQGNYPYAVAIVIIFMLLPTAFKLLDKINYEKLQPFFYFLSFLMVISPTIFGKDIWSFQSGGSILLNSYLVFMGYYINRFQLLNHRRRFLKLISSLFVYGLMSLVMTHISLAVHFNYISVNRFNVTYSVFAVVASLFLFDWLDKLTIKVSLSIHSVYTVLIVTFIFTNQNVSIRLMEWLRRQHTNPLPDIQRFFVIAENILFLALAVTIVVIATVTIGKVSWINNMIEKISFQSFTELFQILIKIKNYLLKNKKLIFVATSFYLITSLQMIMVSLTVNNWKYPVSLVFWNYQPAMVLSTVILIMFFLLLFLITNRFWYAYGFIFVVEVLLTISTILKIKMRNEPVLPTDMSALKSANDVLNMVSPTIVIVGVIGMMFFIVITIILQLRYRKHFNINLHIKRRIFYIAILLVGLSGIGFANHENTIPGRVFEIFRIKKLFYDQSRGATLNGPLLQFINNMDVSVMSKPHGYSKERIHEIMQKYDKEAATLNATRNSWAKNQTMIFVLSESFSDPARVPNLTIDGNPIPNILNIKNNNTSGLMMSNGYGGGTANMEWQSLTGLNLSSLSPTLPTPYSQLVDKLKLNPNITNLFDQKIAVHPFNASLYNRKDVFKDFGFEKFYYDGSKNKLKYMNKNSASPYVSDESAYKDVEGLVSTNSDKSQFIQLSTMQNHMPYDLNDSSKSLNVTGSAIGSRHEVKNYIQRIRYTDNDVKAFLERLDQINRPITVVWYGDHLPGIYSGDAMDKYAVQLHQTDYFIYNNKMSRNNIKENKLVAAYSFPSLALKQANIKVSPYYALMTKVTDDVPAAINNPYTTQNNVFNGSQVFMSNDETIKNYSQLTRKQKQIFDDYNLIQYDIVAGKQYSAKWAMQKVK